MGFNQSGACLVFGLLVVVGGGLATSPMARADTVDGKAFVAVFADACVPGRSSHEKMMAHLLKTGWARAERGDHPELQTVVAASDVEMKDAAEPDWVFKREAFARTVEGRAYHVIATYVHAPDIITLAGCYLYDFSATQSVPSEHVTAWLGVPVSRNTPVSGSVVSVWGPSPKHPRTFDTYLYYSAEGSMLAERAGFSGVMMKFETSVEPMAVK